MEDTDDGSFLLNISSAGIGGQNLIFFPHIPHEGYKTLKLTLEYQRANGCGENCINFFSVLLALMNRKEDIRYNTKYVLSKKSKSSISRHDYIRTQFNAHP